MKDDAWICAPKTDSDFGPGLRCERCVDVCVCVQGVFVRVSVFKGCLCVYTCKHPLHRHTGSMSDSKGIL